MSKFSEAVEDLGTTAESVISKLRERGIKGTRYNASECPLAKYLHTCGFPDVSITTVAQLYDYSLAVEYVPLPPQVYEWERQFDDGKFPEFIRDESSIPEKPRQ